MSRHGYIEYDDYYDEDPNLMMGRWQGQLASAMRGKRGQQFFRDLVAALDAMPVKEVHLHNVSGECLCAMGAVAAYRNVDLSEQQAELDDEDGDHLWATEVTGDRLNIASQLAREVTYINDDMGPHNETPAQRWTRIRKWAVSKLKDQGST